MIDYVELRSKRNRGWPWPEDSFGLTPMYGESGWCRSCGMPLDVQTGPLVLQHKGLTAKGAWVPNWQFDAICLESSLAERLASSFELEMRAVEAPGGGAIDGVMQIVAPSVGRAWFDRDQLRAKAIQTHGSAGSRCDDCRRWRWLPLSFAPMPPPFGTLPPLGVDALTLDVDIAASPEWFGDGWNCFRQILVRRELAEIIAQESPRDFKVNEVV